MTFADVLMACGRQREFVENYDRLRGTNLSRRGSPMDLAIDDSTGRMEAEAPGFIAFVWDAIWLRLPPDIRA